jgi:acetylornithine deacetylase/succinyl-diaminopimelate desuccinylase-like protein
MDTVFAADHAFQETRWLEDGVLNGPGVADMKGGIAVAVHAARALASGPRPFALVEVVSCPDEESRPGPPATIERLQSFDAVLCLECGRPSGEVVSARKGAAWLRVHAEGRAAHAGEAPRSGRNVAVALAREALRLTELDGTREGMTLQVTELEAGEGLNTVPSRGFLSADVRAATQADLDWAVARIGAFPAYDGIVLRFESAARRRSNARPRSACWRRRRSRSATRSGTTSARRSPVACRTARGRQVAGSRPSTASAPSGATTIPRRSTSRRQALLLAAAWSQVSWPRSTPACSAPNR